MSKFIKLNKDNIRNDYLRDVVMKLVTQRKRMRLTQDDLDHRLGNADRLVSKWECGIRTPTSFNLYCWAFALGMRLTVAGNDNIPPANVQKQSKYKAVNDNGYGILKR